jgi:hypothetical protein
MLDGPPRAFWSTWIRATRFDTAVVFDVPGPAVWRGYPRECTLFKAQRALARAKAPLAQSVERFHGKEKVNGSIPLGGSVVAELLHGAERHPDGGVAQLVRAHDS